MYELLQRLCKEKGTNITNLCIVITGSSGNLPTWKKGNINPESLRKIADYFDVSADYLLGRTNDPNTTGISVTDNKQLSLTGNNSISINANRNNSTSDNPDDKQLLEMIKSLDLVERSKIITQIDEMKNKK